MTPFPVVPTGVLIVGVGNPDRGDDGVGPAVADHFREHPLPGVRTVQSRGDLSRLLDEWEGTALTCVVDALRPGAQPGRLMRWEMGEGKFPSGPSWTSTHAIALEQVIELGRALGRVPDRLVLYGVEASDLETGHGISPAVASVLPELIVRVGEEVRSSRDRTTSRAAPEVNHA